MAIESLQDLSHLSSAELYEVYLPIAMADHRWRLRTLYGDGSPPTGHHAFRPLPYPQFEQRLLLAQTIDNGEQLLRRRLSRQAAAYEVDIQRVLGYQRQAA